MGLFQVAMMKIGYARVYSEEQILELQKDALKDAGCKILGYRRAGRVRTGQKPLSAPLAGGGPWAVPPS